MTSTGRGHSTGKRDLPLVLAGPILRRAEPTRLVFWLATTAVARVRLELDCGDGGATLHELEPGTPACLHLAAGERLHYLLIDLALTQPLPTGRWIGYSFALASVACEAPRWHDWREWAPDLCYPGKPTPGFVIAPRVASLLHGSCRKPHYPADDGLVVADALLERCLSGVDSSAVTSTPDDEDELPAWPAMLVLSGDQVYADDVAGPVLRAIHRLVGVLGLPLETLAGAQDAGVKDSAQLYDHPDSYYRRDRLLPRLARNRALIEILFGGVEKPVFTADAAHNHLISLAEMLAMYLLVWSPAPWQLINIDPPDGLSPDERALFAREREVVASFVAGLSQVRRVFAHLPVAMIFDDHDITDDWNLSRAWEETAYGHPFSRRVIGNALLAYLINQGWGNQPEAFDAARLARLGAALAAPGGEYHDECISDALAFEQWHYTWPTEPPLVVIDTRTRRWHSTAAGRPSGLMNWEALTDLQQSLRGASAVLLVSPAPIFGVKLIETIQRMFTWFGQPLLVDAENWMAHRGAAYAILNIFRHRETPRNFVVLSGDVHYSFVYDVELRGIVRGPDIWQICSSGLRNTFPPRLLAVLDRANRWLYSPRSPLNWFTRRRKMRVIPRKPAGTPSGRRLLNGSGIGLVELDSEGVPWRIRQCLGARRSVVFTRREAESRWD